MQILDNPLMEIYKMIRRYGKIMSDDVIETETNHSRHLSIIYLDREYLVSLENGEVKFIRML